MFVKIPFESEITFKSNISEITKMSLEHDFNVNDDVVLGNFYISGEYKSHEVSINTEEFQYTLPFSVDYRNDLDVDTLEFNIEDFTYEILNNNILKIHIEYSLKGEVKKELFERVDERELESEMAYIDEFLEKDKNEVIEEKNVKEVSEVDSNPIIAEEVIEERLDEKEEKTVMDTIKNSDDTFVTYHIHIVKENETIDSICSLYKVQTSLLNEYNNLDNIANGDKILIPKIDE